jgi:hypothetical protein
VRFTRLPELGELSVEVLFASSEHDTTICRLPRLVEPAGAPLGLRLGPADRLMSAAGSGRPDRSRCLVVGHPRGHDVRISLYDTRVIELHEGEGRLRYRSPTDAGSSGSPVLDDDLNVIAMHHASNAGAGFNEGILLSRVRQLAAGQL